MKTLSKILATLSLLISLSAQAVNVNTAGQDELAKELIGVGDAKAAAIVAYREKHGPFKAASDLDAVKGIGAATLAKNQDNITF